MSSKAQGEGSELPRDLASARASICGGAELSLELDEPFRDENRGGGRHLRVRELDHHEAPPVGRDVVLAVALKTVLQPVAAYVVARWVLGLEGAALIAPTLLAALPTAQNVYVYAVHYRASRTLARSAVLLSTLLSIPLMTAIVGILG